jgi:hypothetical protein
MRFAPQASPAAGSALFCTAGSRASSGLEPGESEPPWSLGGTAVATSLRRHVVQWASYGNRQAKFLRDFW